MMQYLFIVSAGAFLLRDAQVPTVAAPLAATTAAAVAPAVVTTPAPAVPVVGAAPAALSPEAAAQQVMEQQLLNDPAVASASAEAETWAEKFGTITANLTVHAITEVVGKVARERARMEVEKVFQGMLATTPPPVAATTPGPVAAAAPVTTVAAAAPAAAPATAAPAIPAAAL